VSPCAAIRECRLRRGALSIRRNGDADGAANGRETAHNQPSGCRTGQTRAPTLVNTGPLDITGHPAISVPAGLLDGLPAGMTIMGKRFDDASVLRVADAFESLCGAGTLRSFGHRRIHGETCGRCRAAFDGRYPLGRMPADITFVAQESAAGPEQ
jgi:hypothetical protein